MHLLKFLAGSEWLKSQPQHCWLQTCNSLHSSQALPWVTESLLCRSAGLVSSAFYCFFNYGEETSESYKLQHSHTLDVSWAFLLPSAVSDLIQRHQQCKAISVLLWCGLVSQIKILENSASNSPDIPCGVGFKEVPISGLPFLCHWYWIHRIVNKHW